MSPLPSDAIPAVSTSLGSNAPVAEVARQDTQFFNRVDAVDVVCRIGLRIASPLSVSQCRGEIGAILSHARHDEVRGAVDDAAEGGDVARQRAASECAEEGDTGEHRRLVAQRDAGVGRGIEQLVAVSGEERFVCGDDRDAALERGQHKCPGRFESAERLDGEIEIVVDNVPQVRRQIEVFDMRAIAKRVANQADADADFVLTFADQCRDRAADAADAEESDAPRAR